MKSPCTNVSSSCQLLSLKHKSIAAIASSLFVLSSLVSIAFAQSDNKSQEAAEGWKVEVADPPELEKEADSQIAVDSPAELKAVDTSTELKAVDTSAELKAVDTSTEPKAVADLKITDPAQELHGIDPVAELKRVNNERTVVESNTELKTVNPTTELKTVNPTTELKAVDSTTELKAVASDGAIKAVNTNELRVVENESAVASRPLLNLDPQLKADLDSQYDRVQKTLETADAFSESLGEDYLSYGLLLKQAGRLDDAREVLIDAAHISKINNGLNSIEQRPYLAALFDIHMLQDNVESADKAIQRIMWLENENPKVQDALTYPMALRMGNRYLDEFLFKPVAGSASLESLSQADRYYNYVLRRYGSRSINEFKLPYGELALVNFWRSKVAATTSAPANFPALSGRGNRLGQLPNTGGRRFNNVVAPTGGVFFSRAEFYLKRYLARTRAEGTPQMVINAILNLGDINLMFERRLVASQYYELAWAEGLRLSPDDPVLKTFERPVALPAFDYASERKHVVKGDQALLVPMTFRVDQFGRVSNVKPIPEGNKNFPYFSKARRAVRRTTYRPVIRDGKLVSTDLVSDDVLVQITDAVEVPDAPAPEPSEEAALEASVIEVDDALISEQEPST